ncbi:hypothetical protein V5P93_004590 [Actinokineospora auranticolor]|nr:hypothetical protein [Actinokineospora auranticolor]
MTGWFKSWADAACQVDLPANVALVFGPNAARVMVDFFIGAQP